MDRLLVEGVGGFTTRNEFVREAIESYLLELTHEPAPPEPAALARHGRDRLAVAPSLLDPGQPELFDEHARAARPLSLEATALAPLPADVPVITGEAHVVAEPLFGMHNRDYPSLCVARRLVEFLGDGPLLFDEFAERATEDAWSFAEGLLTLESESGKKLTALFPTNTEKRQTASSAFRVFAIGAVGADGGPRAEGALSLWPVITVQANERGYLAARQRGLTDSKAVQALRRYAGGRRGDARAGEPPREPDQARRVSRRGPPRGRARRGRAGGALDPAGVRPHRQGCSHGGGFNGAGHSSFDIDTWWIAPDPGRLTSQGRLTHGAPLLGQTLVGSTQSVWLSQLNETPI